MCNYESNPTVFNCTFSMNNGNGMYNSWSSPKVTNSTFSRNSTTYDGGGMYNFYSNLILNKCEFIFNSADSTGGGMCNVVSIVALTHCIFSGNSANYFGGGMCNSHGSPTMVNCIFTRNLSTEGGGICIWYNSNAIQSNCILWANTAVNGSEIAVRHESILSLSYSNIKDGKAGVYDPCECVIWGSDNIDVDPCFCDPNAGDYHLKSPAGRWNTNEGRWTRDEVTSPCIDAGDPMSPIGLEPFPNGGRINMGAYGGTAEASKSYFGRPVCETIVAGDINGDCKVNFLDFALMAFHWLEDNSP